MAERKPLDELGYWEQGKAVWHFYEEFTLPDGHTVKLIDFTNLSVEGITYQQILEAMTSPDAKVLPFGEDEEQ